jgi:hypothetical protein
MDKEILEGIVGPVKHRIKKDRRRREMKKTKSIKRLPSTYYTDQSIRDMYKQMVASLDYE